MRTLISLPEEEVQILQTLGEIKKLSRAEMIRRAVRDYIAKNEKHINSGLDDAFGILKSKKIDAIELQKSLRNEW